jgi:hypothetical protein
MYELHVRKILTSYTNIKIISRISMATLSSMSPAKSEVVWALTASLVGARQAMAEALAIGR